MLVNLKGSTNHWSRFVGRAQMRHCLPTRYTPHRRPSSIWLGSDSLHLRASRGKSNVLSAARLSCGLITRLNQSWIRPKLISLDLTMDHLSAGRQSSSGACPLNCYLAAGFLFPLVVGVRGMTSARAGEGGAGWAAGLAEDSFEGALNSVFMLSAKLVHSCPLSEGHCPLAISHATAPKTPMDKRYRHTTVSSSKRDVASTFGNSVRTYTLTMSSVQYTERFSPV